MERESMTVSLETDTEAVFLNPEGAKPVTLLVLLPLAMEDTAPDVWGALEDSGFEEVGEVAFVEDAVAAEEVVLIEELLHM